MKTLLISCVFPPEPVISAQTSAQIAEKMAELGYQVKVLAPFPSRPTRQTYPQYKRGLLKSETCLRGYEIIRCFSFFSSISSLSSRFLENISFGISVFFILLFSSRADIVYGNTWPIFAQGLLMLVCKLRHMPLVLSIQDLYPESLAVQNRMKKKGGRYFRFLRWLDILVAKNCQSLIVISEQFKRIYVQDRGIQEEKIHVVPNWIDSDQDSVDHQDDSIRQFHNIPKDAFLVVFGGNIGVAAGVEHLIDAFQHLLLQKNIYLLLAGSGNSLPNCLERIQKYQLEHVKIHSPWQVSDTFAVLSTADLCILPTVGDQSLVSVPSKLLSYFLAGRCVLALAAPKSEIARIISDSQAGWIISTNEAGALADCIIEISKMSPDELGSRGQAGRHFALKHFSKSANIAKVVEILERVEGQHG